MIKEGYKKYKRRPFKVAQLFRWDVVVTGPTLIDELRKAPDDILSLKEALADALSLEFTLGPSVLHNPYHIPIIRTTLTRNLGAVFPDVREEMADAFNDIIPPGDEWIKRPALHTVMRIIARTSNRIFVGLPLCGYYNIHKMRGPKSSFTP